MKDLRQYSTKELSLTVFNNHYLYSKMMEFYDNKLVNTTFALIDLLSREGYRYNNKQWSFFISDVNSHIKELKSIHQ